jgi:hypothetical protein
MLGTKSANYVRTELPVRIAHRLRDLQALPYVVVTQEGVAKVYEVRKPCIRIKPGTYIAGFYSYTGLHLRSMCPFTWVPFECTQLGLGSDDTHL